MSSELPIGERYDGVCLGLLTAGQFAQRMDPRVLRVLEGDWEPYENQLRCTRYLTAIVQAHDDPSGVTRDDAVCLLVFLDQTTGVPLWLRERLGREPSTDLSQISDERLRLLYSRTIIHALCVGDRPASSHGSMTAAAGWWLRRLTGRHRRYPSWAAGAPRSSGTRRVSR